MRGRVMAVVGVVFASITVLAPRPAAGRAACTEVRPKITSPLPDRGSGRDLPKVPSTFVQTDPRTWQMEVSVPSAAPGCGAEAELEVVRLTLNDRWLQRRTDKTVGSSFRYEAISGCSASGSCEFRLGEHRTVPLSPDARGVATGAIPTELGTGLFRVRARVTSGGQEVWSTPRFFRLTSARYAQLDADARAAMIRHARKLIDASGDAPPIDGARDLQRASKLEAMARSQRQFLSYAQAPGGDRIAEVYGDLVRAAQVAIVVPGLTMTVGIGYSCSAPEVDASCRSGKWNKNAERLWKEAAKLGGDRTAVIAYMNYDAPGWSNVAHDEAAVHGAEQLLSDVRSWELGGSKRVVAVGHSYGSLVLGIAAASGLAARDLVVVGSPGLDVWGGAGACTHGTFFATVAVGTGSGVGSGRCCPEAAGPSCFGQVGRLHSWVARFDQDPVTRHFAVFGIHPDDDDFGAIEFDSEPPQCRVALGFDLVRTKCHSKYFDWGQRALLNQARIVVGRYESVTRVGRDEDRSVGSATLPRSHRATLPSGAWPDPSSDACIDAASAEDLWGAEMPGWADATAGPIACDGNWAVVAVMQGGDQSAVAIFHRDGAVWTFVSGHIGEGGDANGLCSPLLGIDDPFPSGLGGVTCQSEGSSAPAAPTGVDPCSDEWWDVVALHACGDLGEVLHSGDLAISVTDADVADRKLCVAVTVFNEGTSSQPALEDWVVALPSPGIKLLYAEEDDIDSEEGFPAGATRHGTVCWTARAGEDGQMLIRAQAEDGVLGWRASIHS